MTLAGEALLTFKFVCINLLATYIVLGTLLDGLYVHGLVVDLSSKEDWHGKEDVQPF